MHPNKEKKLDLDEEVAQPSKSDGLSRLLATAIAL
jgi:hypothetical protein